MHIVEKIFIFLIIGFLFESCSNQPPQNPPTISLPPASITSTTHPISISTNASTLPFPTNTPTTLPTLTSTPTEVPVTILDYRCLNVSPSVPANHEINGVIVLEQETGADHSILINMETGENMYLVDAYQLRISQDGRQIAYINTTGQITEWQLIVKTSGEDQITIPWEDDWDGIAQWLDNYHLLIYRQRFAIQGFRELDSIIVFNPFTGDKQELLPDYPDINVLSPSPGEKLWQDYIFSRAVYNTNLDRVIYQALKNNNTPIILMDLQSTQTLAQLNAISLFYGSLPRWSPDGSQFITDLSAALNGASTQNFNGTELYSVTREGEITRLTYFTDSYDTEIHDYSWSPDGRFVAFWLKIGPSEFTDERLAILDVASGRVTNYCVPGDPINSAAPAPVWSLDGRQLVTEARDPQDSNHRLVFLIDITQGFYTQIAENVTPAGWMVAP